METKKLIQGLKKFLKESEKSDYSSGDSKSWIKEKDGSTSIKYVSGEWKLNDSFFGGEPYGGRTIVHYKNKPVWIFIYYGWVDASVKDLQSVYDFLKDSLKKESEEKMFRGPRRFEEGRFVYKNSWKGKHEKFEGEEKIYDNAREVYRAKYMGGLVDQRKDLETA